MEPRAATAKRSTEAPRRRALDRELILDGAEAIARAEGISRLTLRRLGEELGADPTAIYRHFRDKDEFLIALADRLFGTRPELDPSLPWRERAKAEIRHAYERYSCHPDLAALLAIQPENLPSLQELMERVLELLAELGLSPRDAARAFALLENHVVGTGLFHALVAYSDDPKLKDPAAMRRHYALLPADRFPRAVEAAPYLFPDPEEVFEAATDMILDQIERLAREGGHDSDVPRASGDREEAR